MPLPLFPPVVLIALTVFVCCLVSAGIGILLNGAKFKKIKLVNARIIIAVSFAGIITLYFLFYAISNAIGRSSVEDMWEKIEAEGLTTTPDRIIPRNPNYYWKNKNKITFADTRRQSDNSVPLYEAAIALIKNSDVTNKRFDIFWKNRKKTKKPYSIPLYNTTQYNVPSWPVKDQAEAVKLSKNRDVQQALLYFSRGNRKPYAVNLKYYTNIDIDMQAILPRLNNYREIFRMISFVSECYALEGKTNKAYDLIIDGFKFIRQFRNEPILISHIVYIACTWIDLRTLNSLISRYGINSKKARECTKVLSQLDFNKSMQKGLHGNLILFTSSLFKEIITGEKIYNYSVFGKSKAFADYAYFYPFLYQGYASYIEFWLQNYKLYDKPYWQIKSRLEKLNKEKPSFLLTQNSADYLLSDRLKAARTNSIIAATKVILALHIYKNKHGNFPEKLSALIPGTLKKISVDPLSGKAYSYKKEGGYFKLTGFYSDEK